MQKVRKHFFTEKNPYVQNIFVQNMPRKKGRNNISLCWVGARILIIGGYKNALLHPLLGGMVL
jgi:hypothetical protein